MTRLLADQDLTRLGVQEYFQNAIRTAIANQQFSASDESVVYLVNLLTAFLRSDRLFDPTPDGLMIRPLATIYGDALAAHTERDKTQTLQRLGDIALFIAGLYAQSLSRCLVDVDYYIAMGENAYGYLAESRRNARKQMVLTQVFDELSERFVGFMEILAEVGENSRLSGNADILRMYELWLHTGNDRVAKKLHALGIHPLRVQRRVH
jgi:hypothetical protein